MQKNLNPVFKFFQREDTNLTNSCVPLLGKFYKVPDWQTNKAYRYCESQGNYAMSIQNINMGNSHNNFYCKGIHIVAMPFLAFINSKSINPLLKMR